MYTASYGLYNAGLRCVRQITTFPTFFYVGSKVLFVCVNELRCFPLTAMRSENYIYTQQRYLQCTVKYGTREKLRSHWKLREGETVISDKHNVHGEIQSVA